MWGGRKAVVYLKCVRHGRKALNCQHRPRDALNSQLTGLRSMRRVGQEGAEDWSLNRFVAALCDAKLCAVDNAGRDRQCGGRRRRGECGVRIGPAAVARRAREHSIDQAVVVDPATYRIHKWSCFVECCLCLSRACLGKMIILTKPWTKTTGFLPPRVGSSTVCTEPFSTLTTAGPAAAELPIGTKNATFSLSFPYVCPEPVLAK